MNYFDDWKDSGEEQMLNDFRIKPEEIQGCEILFASYTYEDYSGSAFVLFKKDGKLYEVNGGHCSCYGLEGCWEPEETLVSAIKLRFCKEGMLTSGYGSNPESDRVLLELLNKLEQEGVM